MADLRQITQEALYIEGKCNGNLSPFDTAETANVCAKTRSCEPHLLPATDPKIRQHLIFCSLSLKLLIYHFKDLIHPNISLSQLARWRHFTQFVLCLFTLLGIRALCCMQAAVLEARDISIKYLKRYSSLKNHKNLIAQSNLLIFFLVNSSKFNFICRRRWHSCSWFKN